MTQRRIRVMTVDDSTFVSSKLKTIFEKSGMSVVGQAKNGLEALSLYKKCHPDVIILDINMPEMDGLSALENLKRLNPNVKVVMCTSLGTKDKVIEALKAGAKNFITKPFLPERVVAIIRKTVLD